MPILFILVGLPGSGKSTWRATHLDGQSYNTESLPYAVISQDDLVDEYAAEHGLTYSEAFKVADLKSFEKIVKERFGAALEAGQNIILDRTNMTVKTRASFMSRVPKAYTKMAVVFEVPDEVLKVRLAERAAATGKHIPEFVVKNMTASYEPPTPEEGFDEIVFVRGS